MYTIHIYLYIYYIVQLSNMLQFFNTVPECPQNWSVCGLKWVSGCSLHSTQPLLTCTLCPSLWLISHLSALDLVTGGCCHCLLHSELLGDCCSPIHFRYKDKGDDALIHCGILAQNIVVVFFTFSFFVECLDNVTEERGSVASNKKDCLYQYSNIWYGNN